LNIIDTSYMIAKTFKCIVFPFIFMLSGILATAQVGVHTDFPDNSSAMDIVATNRGLLIPRVTLTSNLGSPNPVASPAVGLLVFNSGANQPIGFYFWNGTSWVMISTGSPSGNFWSITGNAGTVPGTNFLGTTDNNHFLVYTNNTERMRFLNDGHIVMDTIAPRNATDLLTVKGNSVQTTAIGAYAPGIGFYSKWGRYGLVALVDTAGASPGYGVYSRNYDPLGYGLVSVGSGISSLGLIASHTAGISCYGYDGLHAWGKESTGLGYGICAMGSNAAGSFVISGHTAGVSSVGYDGILARGSNASGRGVIAVGSGGASPSISNESEGGAFTGYHGVYAKAVNTVGIGVIGIGNNAASYTTISGKGLGGSFTGNYGVYGKGLDADGVGVLGLGSGGAAYYTVTNGSGGAFTGYHGLLSVGNNVTSGIGVIAGGNNGVYTLFPSFGAGGSFTGTTIGAAGFGTSASGGIGIIGAGNGASALYPANGSGGAFSGNVGLYSMSVAANGTGIIGLGNNIATPGTFASGAGGSFIGTAAGLVAWGSTAATGTGIIGSGNNIAAPSTYASGSGGAFTGNAAGIVGWAKTVATGIGVIGAGNNATISVPAVGSGGAFTGVTAGVAGYATGNGNGTYGGYFQNGSATSYAYVGYRTSNTNYKVSGNGSVATIVKDTHGERITLTCPEAPEVVFQDFGIGQLIDGVAHITIDPDLAININVNEDHPLKVYITPEGDCKGVYVTNKTANGFDVVELQGGKSNVPFSWQIVATRANEQQTLTDGSVEITNYDLRFPPAPGPLEMIEQPAVVNEKVPLETKKLESITSSKESYKADQTHISQQLEATEDSVIENRDDLND
jgi:hypothetical protein